MEIVILSTMPLATENPPKDINHLINLAALTLRRLDIFSQRTMITHPTINLIRTTTTTTTTTTKRLNLVPKRIAMRILAPLQIFIVIPMRRLHFPRIIIRPQRPPPAHITQIKEILHRRRLRFRHVVLAQIDGAQFTVAVPLDLDGLPGSEIGSLEEGRGATAVLVAAHAGDARVAAFLFGGAEVGVADGEEASRRRLHSILVIEIFLGRQHRISAKAMGLVVIVRAGQKGLGLDAPFVTILLHFLEPEEFQLFFALPILPASCSAEFPVLGLKARGIGLGWFFGRAFDETHLLFQKRGNKSVLEVLGHVTVLAVNANFPGPIRG